MRTHKEPDLLDAVAEKGDYVEVRINNNTPGDETLYVDVNGITVLRIGHIDQPIKVVLL